MKTTHRHSSNLTQNHRCRTSTLPICVLFAVCAHTSSFGQAVTEVVTDFNGIWRSSAAVVNPAKPNNGHNLLAFTFNGVRYSTGVNDAALFSAGLSYATGDYRSLNVSGLSAAANGNTKIGLGALYDGVANGPSAVPPSNGMVQYLTDGVKGLNLGTGVANLPVGTLSFSVNSMQASAIGDGIPDILVTQIADPSGTADSYRFTDAAGNTVGSAQNISFGGIAAVGNWTADFYEASQNPMTLASGFTQTDRPIRLWAADFSAFGITTANYTSVHRLVVNLSGNSDLAFVAYNNPSFVLLPLELTAFTARSLGNDVHLQWSTASERSMSRFEVEWSANGTAFAPAGQVAARNNGSGASNYNFTHVAAPASARYYRLKMVESAGRHSFSTVVQVRRGTDASLNVYPNPATDAVALFHPEAANGNISVWNAAAQCVLSRNAGSGTTTSHIAVGDLPAGVYRVVWATPAEKRTVSFVKR